MRKLAVLISLLISTPVDANNSDWEKTRAVAEAQHEIVLLLITNKEFDKVPVAASRIFELDFPEEHQKMLLDGVKVITDALLSHHQTGVAHEVLDSALEVCDYDKSRAALLREKGYVFKKEGRTEEAMEAFAKSVALENRQP